MVGRERAGQGPAVERLQHGRLDLQEATLVKPLANRRHDGGAPAEQLPRLGVRDQVELALPVAELRVLQPVVLVRRRPQALRQERPALEAKRQLAPLGREDGALGADDVTQVEADQALERLRAEQVLARMELKLSRAIHEVDERGPAMAPPGRDPARHPVAIVGLLAGGDRLVAGANLADLGPALELVRERLHPIGAQPLELLAPLGEQV